MDFITKKGFAVWWKWHSNSLRSCGSAYASRSGLSGVFPFQCREFICTGTVSHEIYTTKTEAFFGSAQVRTVPVCSQISPVQVFSLYFDKKKPLHGIFARFFPHFPMFKRWKLSSSCWKKWINVKNSAKSVENRQNHVENST